MQNYKIKMVLTFKRYISPTSETITCTKNCERIYVSEGLWTTVLIWCLLQSYFHKKNSNYNIWFYSDVLCFLWFWILLYYQLSTWPAVSITCREYSCPRIFRVFWKALWKMCFLEKKCNSIITDNVQQKK